MRSSSEDKASLKIDFCFKKCFENYEFRGLLKNPNLKQ